MSRKRKERDSNIERLNCFLEGLEPFGLFVGCWLAKKWEGDIKKLRSRVRPGSQEYANFYNQVTADLEKFLVNHEFTLEVRDYAYLIVYKMTLLHNDNIIPMKPSSNGFHFRSV